ncbi:MAG: hypothetical protein ACX939_00280, partial [Hyphococcus sp.]
MQRRLRIDLRLFHHRNARCVHPAPGDQDLDNKRQNGREHDQSHTSLFYTAFEYFLNSIRAMARQWTSSGPSARR